MAVAAGRPRGVLLACQAPTPCNGAPSTTPGFTGLLGAAARGRHGEGWRGGAGRGWRWPVRVLLGVMVGRDDTEQGLPDCYTYDYFMEAEKV